MAYIIKKSHYIKDTLQLIDGDRMLEVPVEIDVSRMVFDFNRTYNEILGAQAEIKENPDPSKNNKACERLGEAITSLYTLLFGQESAVEIIDFYQSDYIKMVEDISPYVYDVIVPEIKRYTEEKREQAKDNYLRSKRLQIRRQRRS